MASKITPNRRRILQDAFARAAGPKDGPFRNPEVTNPYHAGLEAVSWRRSAAWLEAQGLLAAYVHGGWVITPAGIAQLREPFSSQDEAHDAAANWMRDNPGHAAVVGWVALRCKGGGWAVRIGFRQGPSVLLPSGFDKERLK